MGDKSRSMVRPRETRIRASRDRVVIDVARDPEKLAVAGVTLLGLALFVWATR